MEEKGKILQVEKIVGLEKMFGGLSADEKRDELGRRKILLEALADLRKADSTADDKAERLGQELDLYKRVVKGRNLGKVLKALGLDDATLYRARTAWRVSKIPGMRTAAEAVGINLCRRDHQKLANRILKDFKLEACSKMTAGELLAFSQAKVGPVVEKFDKAKEVRSLVNRLAVKKMADKSSVVDFTARTMDKAGMRQDEDGDEAFILYMQDVVMALGKLRNIKVDVSIKVVG